MNDYLPRHALRKLHGFMTESGRLQEDPIGHYRRVREIGRGGAGVVYEAVDTQLDRTVALKILHESFGTSEQIRRRFLREARTAAALRHPNIVTVHEVGEADGHMFLAMEHVPGPSLAGLLRSPGRPLERFVTLLEKAARGVGAAHRQGIVHRDLKPGNILIAPPEEPKIADFGLAHIVGSETALTRSGTIVGTPVYMAPEQVRGDSKRISSRTDIYSLGTVLYEILTGRLPHIGINEAEVYDRILNTEPVPPRRIASDIPRSLEAICRKALSKDPGDRHADADAFADDLRRFLEGSPISTQGAGALKRIVRMTVKLRSWILVAAAVLLASTLLLRHFRVGDTEARQNRVELRAEIVRLHLNDVLEARRRGDLERMQQRAAEAEAACRNLLAEASDLPTPYFLLGRLDHLRFHYTSALRWQSQALERSPGFIPARLERALLYARLYEDRMDRLRDSWRRRTHPPFLDRAGTPEEPDPGTLEDGEARKWRERAEADFEGLSTPLAPAFLAHVRGRVEARNLFQNALGAKEEIEEVCERLGRIALRAGKTREALQWYGQGLERDRGSLPLRIGRADVHFQIASSRRGRGADARAHFDAQIEDLEQAVRLAPDRGELWSSLGFARSNVALPDGSPDPSALSRTEQGLQDLERAIALDPSNVEARINRAEIALNRIVFAQLRGEPVDPWFDLAGRDLEAARASAEDLPIVWAALGHFHARRAEVRSQGGEDPLPAYEEALRWLGQTMDSGEQFAPILLFRATVGINAARHLINRKEDPRHYLELALEDLGRAQTISPAWDEVVSLKGCAWTLRGLHKMHERQDPTRDFEAARDALEAAAAMNPQEAETYFLFTTLEVNWGNYDVLVRSDPLDHYEKAATHADRAVTIATDHPVAWFMRGSARGEILRHRLRAGESAEDPEIRKLYGLVVSDFTESLKLNPGDVQPLLRRAECRISMSDWQEARADLEEAVRRAPALVSDPAVAARLELCRSKSSD